MCVYIYIYIYIYIYLYIYMYIHVRDMLEIKQEHLKWLMHCHKIPWSTCSILAWCSLSYFPEQPTRGDSLYILDPSSSFTFSCENVNVIPVGPDTQVPAGPVRATAHLSLVLWALTSSYEQSQGQRLSLLSSFHLIKKWTTLKKLHIKYHFVSQKSK